MYASPLYLLQTPPPRHRTVIELEPSFGAVDDGGALEEGAGAVGGLVGGDDAFDFDVFGGTIGIGELEAHGFHHATLVGVDDDFYGDVHTKI